MRGLLILATLVFVQATPRNAILSHRVLGQTAGPDWQAPIRNNTQASWNSSITAPLHTSPKTSLASLSRRGNFQTTPLNAANRDDFSAESEYLRESRSTAEDAALREQADNFLHFIESVGQIESHAAQVKIKTIIEDITRKGMGYWDRLQLSLQGGLRRSYLEERRWRFTEYYKTSGPDWNGVPYTLRDELNVHGLGFQGLYQTWDVTTKTSDVDLISGVGLEVPYSTAYNPSQGVMIVKTAFKSFDDVQKLYHSDILYQTLAQRVIPKNQLRQNQLSGTRFQPQKLKTIIRHHIVNPGTLAVILMAYSEVFRMDPDAALQDTTWRTWTLGDPSEKWFYALCGTDNVKGVLHLLTDYVVELNWKTIKEIRTRNGLVTDIWITLENY